MLKARRMAYDGRGNAVAKSAADIPAALEALGGLKGGEALYAERWAPFVRELAVMVVRSRSGEVKAFPVVETVHRDSICDTARALRCSRPAPLTPGSSPHRWPLHAPPAFPRRLLPSFAGSDIMCLGCPWLRISYHRFGPSLSCSARRLRASTRRFGRGRPRWRRRLSVRSRRSPALSPGASSRLLYCPSLRSLPRFCPRCWRAVAREI